MDQFSIRKYAFACLFIFSSIFSLQVGANQQAIDWLESQYSVDGSYGLLSDVATPFQSTSEIINAYHLVSNPKNLLSSVQYLDADAYESCEYLSRKIIARTNNGQNADDLIAKLTALQNVDGGYGEMTGYDSTPVDTAIALNALAVANQPNNTVISKAVSYLAQQQQADGGYPLKLPNVSAVYNTALVTIALQKYGYAYALDTTISRANAFITSQRIPGGTWQSNWETAIALRAIATVTSDLTNYAIAIEQFRASQLANGSWDNDVYTTALALQTDFILNQRQLPAAESTGGVTGKIIDTSTGTPLAGVNVRLDSASASLATSTDGLFRVDTIAPGQHTLSFEYQGYLAVSKTINIMAGVLTDTGIIHLSPDVTMGVLAGVITDATTGAPISGAVISVSGIVSLTTASDASGFYQMVLNPGPITVDISANGYDSISGAGSVTGGSVINLSPAMYPAGSTPVSQTVTIKGVAVDADTGTQLVGAGIFINSVQVLNSVDGSFQIDNVASGTITIDIVMDGYQSLHYSALAPQGSVLDLGIVKLQKNQPAFSTVIGHVVDDDYDTPLIGAEIRVQSMPSGFMTDSNGDFRIDNVSGSSFSVTANAVGYLSSVANVSMTLPGTVNVTFRLKRSAVADFDIVDVHTYQQQFEAMTEIEVDAVFSNTGVGDRVIVPYIKVVNSSNEVVEKTLSKTVPLWPTPEQTQVIVPAGTPFESELEWNSERHAPGIYTLIIQAYDAQSVVLLAERAIQIEILPTRKIGGLSEFNPPLAQLAANKPVHLKAAVTNQGNSPIAATSVTARVRLKNKGFTPAISPVDISIVAKQNGIDLPQGMAMDNAGNIYVANGVASGSVSRIAADGTVSEFVANLLSPVDVDTDSADNVYILMPNFSLLRVSPDNQRTVITTGLTQQRAIKVLDDGRILIAVKSALYEVMPDGSVHLIVSNGLSNAQGISIDSKGQLYIANRSDNNIVRYSNGVLSTFVSGINQPYGLTIDKQDNIYVTSYGDNTLVRITPDKQINTIASGLAGPYDVKLASDGNLIVSNNLSSEILTVTPQGDVTVLVAPNIYNPVTAVYGHTGDLFVGNLASANIVRLNPALESSEYLQSTGIKQLKNGRNGGLNVLDNSGLRYVGDNNVESLITSKKYTAFDELPGGGGYLGVYQSSIEQIGSTGQSSLYVQNLITSPQSMHKAVDGSFYILSTNGIIIKVDMNGNYSIIAQNLGSSVYDMTSDASGNLYITNRTSRQILRINTLGVVNVVATTSFSPGAITINEQGELIVAQYLGKDVYSVVNGQESLYTTFPYNVEYDLYVDSIGNLWASHSSSNRVTKLDLSGIFTSYTVTLPRNFAEKSSGEILVSSRGGVVQLASSGTVSTVLSHPSIATFNVPGVGVAPDGSMLILISNGVLYRFAADQTLETSFASIYAPDDLMFGDDGSLFVINQNGQVLKITQQNRLPELLATGSYSKIVKESADTALIATVAAISRFNLVTYEITPVVSGFGAIGALSVNPSGGFVVGDTQRNEVSFYSAQGTLTNSFVGLVRPKGILVADSGELYVVNTSPNKICKLRADGKLEGFSTSSLNAEYMAFNSSGNILATSSGLVAEIDGITGNRLANVNISGNNYGIVTDSSGKSYVNHGSELYQITNSEPELLANGLTAISDLDVDSSGSVFVTDTSSGTVSRVYADGSMSLLLNDLPAANNLVFGADDTVYVQYNANQVMSFNPSVGRTEIKIAGVILTAMGGLLFDNNSLIASIPQIDTVVRMLSVGPNIDPVLGAEIYAVSRPLADIPMSDMKLDIDFGDWLPENSGDYEIDVSLDDGITNGHLVNLLHVGPLAEGEISLATSTVFPGDRVVTGYLNIRGADSTNITNINSDGVAYAASSGATNSRAIAADTYGNIYVADTNSIKRLAPDGSNTTFVTGLVVGTGMAADSSNNIYAVGKNNGNVYKITPDAQYSVLAVLPATAEAVATDYNDVVYAIDQQNLYRIDQDGSTQIMSEIHNGKGLTIDAFGNFYIPTGTLNPWKGNEIIRISPDGKRSAMYFDDASFEFEGVNVTADCSNNLLFAPWRIFSQNDPGNEEDKIVQLIGETGLVRDVLYGPSIDSALRDMDILYYDRFSQRLLIWTDLNAGKVFSFPVVCGGLDVEAHIVTRSDVDLSSTSPSPTSIHDKADGTREFIWLLSQVDNQGQNIQLNMLFKGLTEAERRNAFKEAFLMFNNSFDTANPVKVALDIPEIIASTSVEIQPLLDATQYPANSDVNINVSVNNQADVPFDGNLELSILDAQGVLVATLPSQSVTGVPGNGNTVYSAQWNTAATYAGSYTLHAQLHSSLGYDVASGDVGFTIVTTAAGNTVINSAVVTDKPIYEAWDVVNIEGRVRNDASNVIQLPSTAVLSVSNPDNVLIFSETIDVRELYSQSYQDLGQRFNLIDAQAGNYVITLAVTDASSGSLLTTSTTHFGVSKTSLQSVKGGVTAKPRQLNSGDTVVCESQLTNLSSTDIDQAVIIEQLADMTTGVIFNEQRSTVNLVANASMNMQQSIGTGSLSQGEYACLLSIEFNGDAKQLAAAGFAVTAVANITLNTQVADGHHGRLLVLIDSDISSHDDGDDNDDEGEGEGIHDVVPLTAQRAFLENYLTQQGWIYTIVTDADAFAWELRQGGYSVYALFNEQVKLDEQVQKELREAVYNGDGLLVAGSHDERNHNVDDALGIKYKGKEHHTGVISLLDSPLAITGNQALSYAEKMERIELKGAVLAAVYYPESEQHDDDESDDDQSDSNAAVTYYEYGLGHSVYAAFDLLAQATAMQQENVLDDLISKSLDYVLPQPLRYAVGKAVPITVNVSNEGNATSGRVLLNVPPAMLMIDAGGALLDVSSNVVTRLFDLQAGAADQFTIMVQLPESAVSMAVHEVTQTGMEPDWATYSETDFVITPEIPAGLAEAIAQAKQYVAADKNIKQAYDNLIKAQNYLVQNKPDEAMKYLVKATDALVKSSQNMTAVIRIKVDDVIAVTARLLPMPETSQDDD